MKIKRPDDSRYVKALVFGPPGQGKTYFLGTAQEDPRTSPMLLLDFEGGDETLAGLDIDIAPIRSWDDYSEVYEALSGDHWSLEGSSLKEGESYRSIGIDSISETHTWALLEILDQSTAASARRTDPDLLEIQDYGKATIQMRRLLREFRDLPLHVFYTATAKSADERGVGKVKVPALSGAMSEEVVGLMSVAGYLAVVEEDDEIYRELILQNIPGFRTKVRVPWESEAPDSIQEPTIPALLDALGIPAVEKKRQRKSTTKKEN